MPLSAASTAEPKTAQVTWSPTWPLWRRRKAAMAMADRLAQSVVQENERSDEDGCGSLGEVQQAGAEGPGRRLGGGNSGMASIEYGAGISIPVGEGGGGGDSVIGQVGYQARVRVRRGAAGPVPPAAQWSRLRSGSPLLPRRARDDRLSRRARLDRLLRGWRR